MTREQLMALGPNNRWSVRKVTFGFATPLVWSARPLSGGTGVVFATWSEAFNHACKMAGPA